MKIFNNRFQPCCGLYLNSAVLWMTLLSPIMVACGTGLLILDVVQLWAKWQIERVENVFDFYFRLGLWIAYCVHVLSTLIIDAVFYKSSRTKNTRQLRCCEVSTAITVTFAFLIYYIHTFKFGIHIPTLAIYNAYLIYKYYVVVIIHYFIKEIEDEREYESANRFLTEKEVEEFEEGLIPPPFMCSETKALNLLQDQVIYMQYDKNSCEIEEQNLQIETSSLLGAGAYGAVFKAQLHNKDGYGMTVAVKTTDPDKTDVVYFKALLMEVKMMTRLGKHDHLVEFIGASTANIRQRRLLIVMEFCSYGSLHSFLRSSNGIFMNLVRNGQLCQQKNSNYEFSMSSIPSEEEVSSIKLIKWSYEIACGMEYLEYKKVIHGDLATRNILLNGKQVAKITDFGLARQLYAYSIYVKRQNTPLPWRWLSIESIADMTFSSMSDVWSYGVTVWEIFTLGDVPWITYDFTLAFVEQLKQGLRLSHPQYSTTKLYELMLQCWNKEAADRPNFARIVQFFHDNFPGIVGQQRTPQDISKCTSVETEV